MFDSSSSCELVKLKSNPLPVEWIACPATQDFKLKIKRENCKSSKFVYTLREGVPLPYNPVIEGFNIVFSKSLKPVCDGKLGREEKGFWIFDGVPEARKDVSGLRSTGSREVAPVTGGEDFDVAGEVPEDIFELPNVDAVDGMEGLEDVIEELDSPGLARYKCSKCSYMFQTIDQCRSHLDSEHPGWMSNTTRGDVAGPSMGGAGLGTVTVPNTVRVETHTEKQTPHTNPNWINETKARFKSLVIEKCSQRTREAVAKNDFIMDPKKKKFVSDEIINTTVDYLGEIFGGVGTPKLKDMREIACAMTQHYPRMFGLGEDNLEEITVEEDLEANLAPQVLGGFGDVSTSNLSLNDLAQKMVYRFRDRVRKPAKREAPDEVDDERPKKGKRSEIYGVDNIRFAGRKVTAATVTAISKTTDEDDFAVREAIYEKNRAEMQYQFRNSSKNIIQVCRRFFDSHIHVANHFKYLTKADDLMVNVKKNLPVQIGYLERFLTKADQSLEMKDKLAAIETACDVDYQGSKVYKDIQVLRLAGDYWDNGGSSLMRLKEDGPPDTTFPFILASQVHKSFVFEVWCEKSRLLGPLDMSEAVASFLHVAFIFNLKYPKGAQTICDIIQRLIAKYGDESGTRTQSSKSAAKSKFSKYLSELGKILSE